MIPMEPLGEKKGFRSEKRKKREASDYVLKFVELFLVFVMFGMRRVAIFRCCTWVAKLCHMSVSFVLL